MPTSAIFAENLLYLQILIEHILGAGDMPAHNVMLNMSFLFVFAVQTSHGTQFRSIEILKISIS